MYFVLIYPEHPSGCFGGHIPFLGVDYFIEKCREVYFCTEDYSDATFIISNFCLYSVFYELGLAKKNDPIGEECQNYIELCRKNLEAALANLSILIPATQESIMALALGVSSLSAPILAQTFAYPPAGHVCNRDF